MIEHSSLIPDAHDGLCIEQRAILRYLLYSPRPRHCWKIINTLLEAPNCPTGMSSVVLDTALLTMSHPALAQTSLLDYIGNWAFEAGWIPGPVYRSVRPSPTFVELFREESSRDGSWWDPGPLRAKVPVSLIAGSASWETEVDDKIPREKQSQAARRVRCKSIHCLSCGLRDIVRNLHEFRSTGDLSNCLLFVDSQVWPLSCRYRFIERPVVKVGELRKLCLRRCLREGVPYGVLIGMRRSKQTNSMGSRMFIQSVPKINYIPSGRLGRSTFIIEQPACGRDLWHDAKLISQITTARLVPYEEIGVGIALQVSSHNGLGIENVRLVSEVPFEPLSIELYKNMLENWGSPEKQA